MENELKEPAPKFNFISPEQYLEMERAAEIKHEYYNGEVFTMSGASLNHNIVVSSVNTIVLPKLKGKSCNMFGSDLRIHVPINSLYTYPDFSIICGKAELTDGIKDTITNPSVIIEVLSKSTKDYDRGTKFFLYRSIQTLKEYILIDSTSILVEKYIRQQTNSWILTEFKELHENFYISTISLTLHMKDIYEDVVFEE